MAIKALELQCISLVQQTLKIKTFQTQQKQEGDSAPSNGVLGDLNDSKFYFLVRGILGSTAHKIIDNGLAACMYELVIHCREQYCKFIEERIIQLSLTADRQLTVEDDDEDDSDMENASLDAFSDSSLFLEDVAYLDVSDDDSDSDDDFTFAAVPENTRAPNAAASQPSPQSNSDEDSDEELYVSSLRYNSAINEPQTALRLPYKEWKEFMKQRLPEVQKALRKLTKLHVSIVPVEQERETLYAIEIIGHY